MEGLEPTVASAPPSGALTIEELNQNYNACTNLAGWDAGA
jgi:hypothetical protein